MRSFTITLATPVGALSVRRGTAAEALAKGRELATESTDRVIITDPDGRSFELADFAADRSEDSTG
ncbi:hypothetical protein HJG44_13625 [Enterovirga sp. DB1703]|uniref:Uncharacterized protein n=2 Tax=Enterovirga aerilata TaxID=2730920 RepID=A0A849IHM3_9HYPH|nr:hypothetical protein [Enterovirga sp. DB1703]